MLRVDRGVITKVAIDWYCQVDVLAASTLAFLDYDETAAVAISCQTGHALMHAPRFAHLSWSSPGCRICFWISRNHNTFECEHCGLPLCLDCLGIECPDNVCIECRLSGDTPPPTVVPMHLHAYYLSCELNDALTRSGNYLRYQELDVAFAWPYQLNWMEWLPFALWGKGIEEGTPTELWPDTDDGFRKTWSHVQMWSQPSVYCITTSECLLNVFICCNISFTYRCGHTLL